MQLFMSHATPAAKRARKVMNRYLAGCSRFKTNWECLTLNYEKVTERNGLNIKLVLVFNLGECHFLLDETSRGHQTYTFFVEVLQFLHKRFNVVK